MLCIRNKMRILNLIYLNNFIGAIIMSTRENKLYFFKFNTFLLYECLAFTPILTSLNMEKSNCYFYNVTFY